VRELEAESRKQADESLAVRPVTPETWGDFAALFEARGSPHYCWCMIYRDRQNHEMSKDDKREAMHALVAGGTPVGLLAYDGDEAIGWCSVAPTETFPKLERSRAMPTGGVEPAWNVTCFFVKSSHRRRQVTQTLLKAALEYAADSGAAVVEGYPWDTAANKSRFKGHSSVFRGAGFEQDGTRWHRAVGKAPRRPAATPAPVAPAVSAAGRATGDKSGS
jgi:GNAT superfamily N-acetyltransferase